jgi:hypothetical protein
MRDDILALAGPNLESRHELFNFIIEEIESREPLYSYNIRPVLVRYKINETLCWPLWLHWKSGLLILPINCMFPFL